MSVVTPSPAEPSNRRVPVQERSRARVEAILEAAARVAVEQGVDALNTRSIAHDAGLSVSSIYQYFASVDEIVFELIARDMEEMDNQFATDLGALPEYTLSGVVETVMRAFVTVYRRRPAFVEIWLRGRTTAAVQAYGREHHVRIAAQLRTFLDDLGLLVPGAPQEAGLLAVEIGDRCFQLAFEHQLAGDDFLIEEGIKLISAYLERYAS
ncbi:MAG: TetR/AcrR family transcriptional regulator [Marmoricola sp.]